MTWLRHILILASWGFFLSSCAPLQVHDQDFSGTVGSISGADVERSKNRPRAPKARLLPKYNGKYGYVPKDDNTHVDKWVSYFNKQGRRDMTRYLERSTKYVPEMKVIFRNHGLPEDLVYVSLIESGFSSKAVSNKGAVGFWQFIEPTGKRYGLTINQHIDERRDVYASTEAAASYLKDLYTLFGSWHLALAGYNSGESRVHRAVFQNFDRDFWKLVDNKKIPEETRHFVPKIIAATRIAKNPLGYKFYTLKYESIPEFEEIELLKPNTFRNLSEIFGVPYQELRQLNPKYLTDYIPIYKNVKTYVRVPTDIVIE